MRQLSANAVRELLAPETGEAFLVLMTVEHPSFTTLRVVNNTQDVVSRGQTYIAFPFEPVLPEETDKLPRAQIKVSNVGREIVQALRGFATPADVTLEIVTASNPDLVEVGPFEFSLLGSKYDAGNVIFTLGYEPILADPFPAGAFTPDLFPGLFT